MTYATPTDVAAYLLQDYIDAVEERIPGTVSHHLDAVSAEIDDQLRSRYAVPLSPVPALVTRICAVMAAWRVVGNLTSLVETEASTENEWLPLQRQLSQAQKDLEAIREGKILLDCADADGGGIAVVAPALRFGPDSWGRF